jgi:hypothetical protein
LLVNEREGFRDGEMCSLRSRDWICPPPLGGGGMNGVRLMRARGGEGGFITARGGDVQRPAKRSAAYARTGLEGWVYHCVRNTLET